MSVIEHLAKRIEKTKIKIENIQHSDIIDRHYRCAIKFPKV
jgi:hypothetical protein